MAAQGAWAWVDGTSEDLDGPDEMHVARRSERHGRWYRYACALLFSPSAVGRGTCVYRDTHVPSYSGTVRRYVHVRFA